MDKYTVHLVGLCELNNKQLLDANNPDDKAITDNERVIRAKHRQWGHELLKSISPRHSVQQTKPKGHKQLRPPKIEKAPLAPDIKEYQQTLPTNFPRYLFRSFIWKGGEALIIRGYDKDEKRDVIIKFAIPIISPKKKAIEKKKTKFTKAREYVLNVFENELNNVASEKKRYETEETERFFRAGLLQKGLHRNIQKAGIKHGIIPAIYLVSPASQLYIIMEYIDGENVFVWCQGRTDQEIAEFFLKILMLIEEVVHNWQVVHADIASNNLLVLNNHPVLIDFGNARAMNQAQVTQECSVGKGKPVYAPKEQFEEFFLRDYLVDIWALGCLLWELWNRKPVDYSCLVKRDTESAAQYDYEDIKALFNPSTLPGDIRAIFEKAMAIKRDDRYQDISLFRLEFENLYIRKYALSNTQQCLKPCKYVILLKKDQEKIKDNLSALKDIVYNITDIAKESKGDDNE